MITAVVRGVAMGSLFGLLAMPVAVLRRTTGALSFAHGELGGFAALVAVSIVSHGEPWVVAAVAAVAVGGGVAGGFNLLVGRRIPSHQPVTLSVATVGLLLLLIAAGQRLWGVYPRVVPDVLGGSGVTAFGALVAPSQIAALAAAVACATGFTVVLRRSAAGLATLAAAHDRDEAILLGVPVHLIATVLWALTGAIAAVAAVLFGPVIGAVAPGSMTLFFLRSLVAVTVGGTATMWGPLAGGIAVGVTEQVAVWAFIGRGVPGVDLLAVLALLVLAVAVRGRTTSG